MHSHSEFYTSQGLRIGGRSGDTRPQIPAWEDMMGGMGGARGGAIGSRDGGLEQELGTRFGFGK